MGKIVRVSKRGSFLRKGRDDCMSFASSISNLNLRFGNCFDLSSQYNLFRMPCTYSLQKRNRIRIVIDKPAITDRYELT